MNTSKTKNSLVNISVGDKYGMWTVLNIPIGNGKASCRCDCGTERDVYRGHLKAGKSKSCGCANKYDLTNRKCGRLTVIQKTSRRAGDGSILWKCECECGGIAYVQTSRLLAGGMLSCGCFLKRKVPIGYSAKRNTYMVYKRVAKRKKLKFNLSFDQFIDIITRDCIYCGSNGVSLSKNPRGNGDFQYTGLDMIDSPEGYITDNVVPCCKICNTAKSSRSIDDFEKWVMHVHKRFKNGKTRESI